MTKKKTSAKSRKPTKATAKAKTAKRPRKRTAKRAKPEKRSPSYERWEAFARVCWLEAQALAEIAGEEEELFESIGYTARGLGLACDFVPEDERDPKAAEPKPTATDAPKGDLEPVAEPQPEPAITGDHDPDAADELPPSDTDRYRSEDEDADA